MISKPVVLVRTSTSLSVEPQPGRAVAGPQVADRQLGQPVGQGRVDVQPRPAQVGRGVDPAQDRHEPEDRRRRPTPAARWRRGTGPGSCPRRAAGRRTARAGGWPGTRSVASNMPRRDLGRLGVVAVAPEAAGDHRVVVRPDRARVVAERVVRGVVRRERPDPPAGPHVVGAIRRSHDAAARDRAGRSRSPGSARRWTPRVSIGRFSPSRPR